MPLKKWKDDFVIQAYELARTGLKNSEVARMLGVSPLFFKKWITRKPILRSALIRGRKQYKQAGDSLITFRDYVNGKISPELRPLWDQIVDYDEANSGIEKVEALLKNKGDNIRQYLFLHALICSNFRIQVALRRIGISYHEFCRWKEEDPDFPLLIDEIMWHRGNFFEDRLSMAVVGGDTTAIVFANRTFNRERGYDDKNRSTVDVNVKGHIGHIVVKVDELNLPLEIRKQILKSIRKKKPIESKVISNGQ